MVTHIDLKIIKLFIIVMLFFSFKGIAQNIETNTNDLMDTIIASGNDATGSSGSVTYSIGQIFYTSIEESEYNVVQGIQHQETYNSLDTQDVIDPKIEISIYPNPTTDFVNINMEGYELENGLKSYQLYDFQGRLLKQNTINQNGTQVNLSDLSSSIYLLQVYVDNKALKTFKIIKN